MEVQGKSTESEQELHKISHLENLTKKEGNSHYIRVRLGNVNGRVSKVKFLLLRILIDSRERSLIVLGKHTKTITSQKDPAIQMEYPRW